MLGEESSLAFLACYWIVGSLLGAVLIPLLNRFDCKTYAELLGYVFAIIGVVALATIANPLLQKRCFTLVSGALSGCALRGSVLKASGTDASRSARDFV